MVSAGAIVSVDGAATEVPKGRMEENARNAEALFESRKVEEIREIQKKTVAEAGEKEEELRRGPKTTRAETNDDADRVWSRALRPCVDCA